jgi:hypothetical protein
VDGANFLLYGGHGIYWSAMPTPIVGGFYLSSRDSKGVAQHYSKSSDQIRADLHPAANAIVMLQHACFSAGTSANDTTSIGSAEAQRRVAMYSDAFLDIGAAGYFANWYNNSLQMFVRYLFQGKTLGETYRSYDPHVSTVEQYAHPQHPSDVMWLDKDSMSGFVQYDNAFVGQPNKTLTQLFAAAGTLVSPPLATYIARPADAARTYTVHVDCSTTAVFTWTATLLDGGPWLTLGGVTSGLSGGSSHLVLTESPAGQSLGVHRGHIRVTTSTPDIQNWDQTITVTLSLLANPWHTYAPIMNH